MWSYLPVIEWKHVCDDVHAYMLDRVTCVTEGRLLRVCRVSRVRWGTAPRCVCSRHPGTSRECCPVLPSSFRTPSRPLPWTTRDSSSFILQPAMRGALRGFTERNYTYEHYLNHEFGLRWHRLAKYTWSNVSHFSSVAEPHSRVINAFAVASLSWR